MDYGQDINFEYRKKRSGVCTCFTAGVIVESPNLVFCFFQAILDHRFECVSPVDYDTQVGCSEFKFLRSISKFNFLFAVAGILVGELEDVELLGVK